MLTHWMIQKQDESKKEEQEERDMHSPCLFAQPARGSSRCVASAAPSSADQPGAGSPVATALVFASGQPYQRARGERQRERASLYRTLLIAASGQLDTALDSPACSLSFFRWDSCCSLLALSLRSLLCLPSVSGRLAVTCFRCLSSPSVARSGRPAVSPKTVRSRLHLLAFSFPACQSDSLGPGSSPVNAGESSPRST